MIVEAVRVFLVADLVGVCLLAIWGTWRAFRERGGQGPMSGGY